MPPNETVGAADHHKENEMSYVYIRSEPRLWTVGFYRPDGAWEPESDHGTPNEAADRVVWLNGGQPSDEVRKQCAEEIATAIETIVGGYPDNESERPKLETGLHANDAAWAARIAREYGEKAW